MLTRRTLLTNGLPAVAAFSAVGLAVSKPVEPTTDELVEWANKNHVAVHKWIGIDAWYAVYPTKRYWEQTNASVTLREALLAAKAEIEKDAMGR